MNAEIRADLNGSTPPRPWLKPTAALSRFPPGLPADRGPQLRGRAAVRYGYRIGDIGLLVGERVGCELIALPVIARVPTTPSWLLGVANLRGGLVPIFDLQALFEISATRRRENRFGLIFDRGEHAVGILIPEHPTALGQLEPLPQAPPVPPAARDFVTATFRRGPSIWLEFDHRRFFESVAQRMTG